MAAVTDAYATAAEYRELFVEGSTDTSKDVLYGDVLSGISRIVEQEVGEFFTKDAAVLQRVFVPGCADSLEPLLRVDNIASITGFEIKVDEDQDGSFADETAWATGDYQLRRDGDLNPDKGPEPKPWNEIWIPPWSTKARSWKPDYPVQVTLIFGWPAVPAAVKQATLQLAGIVLMDSDRATTRINELQQVLSTSHSAQSIIGRLQRAYARAAVG